LNINIHTLGTKTGGHKGRQMIIMGKMSLYLNCPVIWQMLVKLNIRPVVC